MSQKSTNLISPGVSLLLERLLRLADWENVKCDWNKTSMFYNISGSKHLDIAGQQALLSLDLGFVLSENQSFLALTNFYLSLSESSQIGSPDILFDSITLLNPTLFLEYRGKIDRLMSIQKQTEEVYAVKAGHDIVALWDLYDELALRLKLTPLFRSVPGKAS